MMRRLGPADYSDMPWKNRGGVTRELLKVPHPIDPSRFLARLSIATVASSGPFSVFPGVDRILTLLEGRGMALSFGGGPEVVLDRPLRPFAFPGEADVQCRLLGEPVRDFNLMVDRAVAEASLGVLHLGPGESRTVSGAWTVLLHALEGQATAAGTPLAREETLWVETPEALSLRSEEGAVLVAIHLTRRG